MQLWITGVASPRGTARVAAQLEEAGWDGHLVVDSQNLSGDPYVALALAEKLKAAGGDSEVFVYDGVGHGFLNDTPEPFKSFEEREAAMGHNYDPKTCELAWERLIAFFKKHLA